MFSLVAIAIRIILAELMAASCKPSLRMPSVAFVLIFVFTQMQKVAPFLSHSECMRIREAMEE